MLLSRVLVQNMSSPGPGGNGVTDEINRDVVLSSSSPEQFWGLQGETRPRTACRELAPVMQRVLWAWLKVAAQGKMFNIRGDRSLQPGEAICSPLRRRWEEGVGR